MADSLELFRSFLSEKPQGDIDSLVSAIRGVESGGNKNAVSPQGAMGSMQIMPGTFKQYAMPGESFDNDEDRTNAALRKIRDDFEFYGGDVAKTAAAYHGGRGAVRSDGSIRDDVSDAHGTTPAKYVDMVLGRMGQPVQSDNDELFQKFMGIAKAKTELPVSNSKRTGGQVVGDALSQLAKGVNTTIGSVTGLVAPESAINDFFQKNAKYWDENQSEYTKTALASAEAKIKEAAKTGVWDEFSTAAVEYMKSPALFQKFVLENAVSFLPGLGAAKAASIAGGAKAGLAAASATNAVMNAGGARQDAFEDWKQTLMKQGMSEEAATQIALEKSRTAAAVGGVAGAFSGGTGLEKGFVGLTGKGGLRRALAGAGAELAGEQAEELLPQLATNLQIQEVDPTRKATDQLGQIAAQTLIASSPGAAVAGISNARPEPKVEDITAAPTVDQAIAAADAVVRADEYRTKPDVPPAGSFADMNELASLIAQERTDVEARRNKIIDEQTAWNQLTQEQQAQKQRDFDLAEQQRREQDIPAMQAEQQDQVVAQAEALTNVGGFESNEPTAMALVSQVANTDVPGSGSVLAPAPVSGTGLPGNRSTRVESSVPETSPVGVANNTNPALTPIQQEVQKIRQSKVNKQARIRAERERMQKPAANSPQIVENVPDAVRPQISPVEQQNRPSQSLSVEQTQPNVGETIPAQEKPPVEPANSLPGQLAETQPDSVQAQPESAENTTVAFEKATQVANDSQRAEEILDRAGITGKERLEAIKDVKRGEISVEELERAHPAKEEKEAMFSKKPAAEEIDNSVEEITIQGIELTEADYDTIEDGLLSNAPKGASRYTRTTKLLARVREASKAIANELGGKAEEGRTVRRRLGPFSEYQVSAEIQPTDDFGNYGALQISFYGKEQRELGLTDSPALFITVAPNGELTINGPAPKSRTFKEFQKRGWADYAPTANGGKSTEYTILQDPANPGHLSRSQKIDILADMRARVGIWIDDKYAFLKWDRATGSIGGLPGSDENSNETWAYFSKGESQDTHSVESFRDSLGQALNSLRSGLSGLLDHPAVRIITDAQIPDRIRGNALFMTAFHGSPYGFDKFSLDHMGKGEGAQAYGWGLYFAGKKEVADYYRNTTSVINLEGVNGKKYGDTQEGAESTARSLLWSFKNDRKTFDAYDDGGKSYMGKIARDIKNGVIREAQGQLYEVNIPEDGEYLLWDKPLSEQPDAVRNVLPGIGVQSRGYPYDWKPSLTMGEAYRQIAADFGSDEKASKALNSLGIAGIKYLDGTSRSEGEGSYNYVIFDDKAVEIINTFYSRDRDIYAYVDPQDGSINFVADNIPKSWSKEELQGLAKHEIAVHAMQMGRDSKEFQSILRELEMMKKAGNKAVQKAYDRVPQETKAQNVDEEALGYLVQESPQLSIAKRFVAWLKQAIRDFGKALPMVQRANFYEWAAKLDENDLNYMAEQALINAGKYMGQGSLEEAPVFSVAGRDRSNIETATRRMGKFIDEFEAGRMKDDDTQIIGPTPTVLQALGVPDLPIQIDGATVRKVLAGKHKYLITPEMMRKIPESVYDPAAIFDSKDQYGRPGKVIVTELTDAVRGDPVIAAIHVSKAAGRYVVNDIASVYSMDRAFDKEKLSPEKLQYVRNEKGLVASTTPNLATSLADVVQKARDLGISVLSEADVVKEYGAGFSRAPLFSRYTVVGNTNRQYTPEQLAAKQNTGFVVETPTFQERLEGIWKNFGKRFAQGAFDQFRPLRELGGQGYMLSRLSKGTASTIEAFLYHGKLTIDKEGVYDADRSGGAVERIFKPLQSETNDFLQWVAANRAEQLSKEDREHLFTAQDILGLKSLDNGVTDFDYTIQNGAKKGTVTRDRTLIYRDALQTFNEFNKNALDMAEQSGLIDGDSRKYWEHEFYVPFYRQSDDDGFVGAKMKSGLVRQQAFKELKGGSNKLNSDLLENTLLNWSHLIDAASKNRAARASLEEAKALGIAMPAAQGTKNSVWYMGKVTRKIPKGQTYEENGVTKVSDGTAEISETGKVNFVLVGEEAPYLMEAITALQYAGLGNWAKPLTAFKHWLTIGVTASPAFKIRNLIRDSIQAIGTSDLGYNPVANIKKGFELTNRDTDRYVSMLASGALIRFGTMETDHSKRIRELTSPDTILDTQAKTKKFFKGILDQYNEIGNRGEEINRAALYDMVLGKTGSRGQAALEARDLMDFAMSGTWEAVRFLSQVVPFFNARLQGMYKLGRAMKNDPRKFGVVLGATAMFSIMLMLAYEDDDDWKKREDWDRDNYWWFKVGDTAMRIPKPFEIGAIATLAERGVELFANDEMTGERFTKRTLAILGDNLSMNPVPQLVKPVMDIYANKDSFSDRPIETMGMDRLKSDRRFTQSTSMAARAVSTAGNSVTGLVGKEFLSPVQVDHLIRGYFGWLGSFTSGFADVIVRPMTDEPTRPSPDAWKLATQGFVQSLEGAPSRYVSQMYDQAKELERVHATYKQILKDGKVEEAKEFAEDNKDKLARYQAVERVKKAEAKFNEIIRIIEKSNLDPDVKRERINQLKDQKDKIARAVAPGYSM